MRTRGWWGARQGDASIVNEARLLSRDAKTTAAVLGKVTVRHARIGKSLGEASVGWSAAPGATGYALG